MVMILLSMSTSCQRRFICSDQRSPVFTLTRKCRRRFGGLWCAGHDTSVTAGTVLHRTRTSLTQWFWAAYLVTSHTKEGVIPAVPKPKTPISGTKASALPEGTR
jgi:hypothetical protein